MYMYVYVHMHSNKLVLYTYMLYWNDSTKIRTLFTTPLLIFSMSNSQLLSRARVVKCVRVGLAAASLILVCVQRKGDLNQPTRLLTGERGGRGREGGRKIERKKGKEGGREKEREERKEENDERGRREGGSQATYCMYILVVRKYTLTTTNRATSSGVTMEVECS